MSKDTRQIRNDILLLRGDLFAFTNQLNSFQENIMAYLDDLVREVKESGDAIDSAIALISGLRDRLSAAGTDPVKLKELADALDAQQARLAAAVAEPEPAQTPEPAPGSGEQPEVEPEAASEEPTPEPGDESGPAPTF